MRSLLTTEQERLPTQSNQDKGNKVLNIFFESLLEANNITKLLFTKYDS